MVTDVLSLHECVLRSADSISSVTDLLRMHRKTGKAFADPSAMTTQMRKDSDFWSLPPLTILCWQRLLVITKHLEDSTWHSPDGQHRNRVDYILVRKRFRSGVNIARTRSFPGAHTGSSHARLADDDLPPLPEKNQQARTRLKFDLEKLKDPSVLKPSKLC